MPEVFTVLLYKGTSSKYANRLRVPNLNGDFMKYAPTEGEEKKKKEGGVQFTSFHCYSDNSYSKNLPCLPQPFPFPGIQINILLLQDPALL